MQLKPGVSIIIDGQFGSTGKGLIAGYIGKRVKIDVAVTNAGPNSGHTFIDGDKKVLAFHLPVSGIVNPDKPIMYLCAGSIIDPNILLQEMMDYEGYDLARRLFISPRAAILEQQDYDKENEAGSAQTGLASTRKGVGAALARKVMREATLAGDHPDLVPYVKHHWSVGAWVHNSPEDVILMEVPQGMDLSLNHGLSYPHCTSREVSPAQAMSDLGVHPYHLGDTILTLRTCPIRVGNIYSQDGTILGASGPYWPDQKELSWADVGVEPELTTVTKRPRRIFSWSKYQVQASMQRARPTMVFLNFAQYVDEPELKSMMDFIWSIGKRLDLKLKVIYTGWGPDDADVRVSYTSMDWKP